MAECSVLRLVTALNAAEDRGAAARSLAQFLGAEDLIIFVMDPEVGVLLPALGFPQTLPEGRRWRAFLASCSAADPYKAELIPPGGTDPVRVTGMAASDGSILALLGGHPRLEAMRDTLALVPLLAATLRGERRFMLAEAQVRSARQAVTEATMLAAALDNTRHQLQDALVTVEGALHARDEFLSIASHELKTPITGLLLQVQMFQRFARRLATRDAPIERISAMADTMERQVKRLSQLTHDLLDTSRITSGRLDLRIEKVDLVELTQDIIERFGDEAAVHGSTIHLHADAPVVGEWDRSRLDQVLTNMLSNAIKYGRGEPIQVTVINDGDHARLTVRDHGIGIDAADRERIFDRFERVRISGDPGGLGLGLYITRQIVNEHGGNIEVDDTPGGGSTFTVALPLRASEVTGEDGDR